MPVLDDRHSEALGPRHTVWRVVNGGKTQEQWLTEPQATYVIAKCETPVANEILQKVIAVFAVSKRRIAVYLCTATPRLRRLCPQFPEQSLHRLLERFAFGAVRRDVVHEQIADLAEVEL